MRLVLLLTSLFMLPAQSAPFLVAHRGASGDAPENTLPAFQLAWKQGADAIEGDFHLTRDNEIVCIHDADTKKVAGKKLIVKESTLAELRTLDVGSAKDRKFANTRIPTLAEVLATVPDGKQVYIEIKCGPEIVPHLVEHLKHCPLGHDQVTIISFSTEVIRSVKKHAPQLTANWLCSFGGRSRNNPARDWPRILETLSDTGANGLGSSGHKDITPKLIDQLHQAGFQYHVWTIDDAKVARHFLEIGTKSVTTNYPGKLREALANP